MIRLGILKYSNLVKVQVEMSGREKITSIFMGLRDRLASSVASLVPPADVEDVVQEAYVRICQIKHLDDIQSPKSFLYKTVRNLALDQRKRAETRLVDRIENFDELFDGLNVRQKDQTFEQVATNQEFGLFCEAVRQLPPQCRKVFVLKKVYGYSQAEIANEMNISKNTVENHIALGIKRCTQFMERHDEMFGTQGACYGRSAESSTLANARGASTDE